MPQHGATLENPTPMSETEKKFVETIWLPPRGPYTLILNDFNSYIRWYPHRYPTILTDFMERNRTAAIRVGSS